MIPIYRDRLRLDVMVTNTFAAILALRPDHPEALKALAERHEAHGRWADLIDVLGRQAGVSDDPEEKVRLYHRIAALWSEKLAKQQNAVGALEKILEIDPAEETARRRLKEIYTRGRSWRPLLELMRRELRLLPQAQHGGHLATMAEIASDRLSAPREAIGLWNEVLELAPREPTALAALAKLYEKEGRWAPLVEVLGRQATALGEDTSQGCELLEKRGLILLEKLGATAAAEATLRKVHAGGAGEPAGAAGAAGDPRQHRRLRGAGGPVRQARRLGRAVRGADLGGGTGPRRGLAGAPADPGGGRRRGRPEAARTGGEGLREDPRHPAAQPPERLDADAAVPGDRALGPSAVSLRDRSRGSRRARPAWTPTRRR